ncbi:MAG: D-alanyl-D-alanine carboxypeptidase [Desulfobacterales bacterium]|nr:D-alanyl-D-alanine carboxypeptidase [Desulfobacterales bacterium]
MILRCLAVLTVAALLLPVTAGAKPVEDRFTRLSRHLGPGDALLITGANGRALVSVNADRAIVPASTLKILTALVAIEVLGPSYRFPTELFVDSLGNLFLKGYGDPLLISETIAEMAVDAAARLAPTNTVIADLVVDDTFFNRPTIPGVIGSLEPYDAPNGAVCANFNTVHYATVNGRQVSAEPQTPLVDFARRLIISHAPPQGRITLSHDADAIALYAGHLLAHFLAREGIPVQGTIRRGTVTTGEAQLLTTYLSPFPLTRVVAKMLAFSNNFMANQLLIASGANRFGSPGTLAKGVAAAVEIAQSRFGIKDLNLVEGSGISRQNRIRARDLDRILTAFAPYRNLLRSNGPERYKTGTLDGIRTRTGYFDTSSGETLQYVVFITGRGRTLNPVMVELRDLIGGE